jgi:hypothetical protein
MRFQWAILGTWLFLLILNFTIWGAGIYLLVHFVRKFW